MSLHVQSSHVSTRAATLLYVMLRFDALLGGGATQGCVLELAGESATGKTQACLSMAALTASRGEGVIYIDATNAFSARRLVQLGVEGHVCPDVDTMLQAVHVYRTHSLQHLLSTLDAVLLQLRTAQAARTAVMEQHAQAVLAFQAAATANPQGVQGPPPPPPPLPSKPSLLILDSISALGGSVMGERRHAQGMALLMCVGRQLRQLADAFGLAVVVTNHLVADRSAERLGGKDGGPAVDVSSTAQPMVPAMGEWWKGQVHARLQLRLGPSGALGEPKIATLTLHQDMVSCEPPCAVCCFGFGMVGMCELSWCCNRRGAARLFCTRSTPRIALAVGKSAQNQLAHKLCTCFCSMP